MQAKRLTLCIVLAACCPGAFGDEVSPVPPSVPPHPVGEQVAVSPLHEMLREKLKARDNLQQQIEDLAIATGTPQQFLVRVQLMEVNRTQLRNLGIDYETNSAARDRRRALRGDASQARSSGYVAPASYMETGDESTAFDDPSDLRRLATLLEKNGIARTIADPVLVTVSGRPASFRNGGELLVPLAPSPSGVGYQYQHVGTELSVLPVPLGNRRVRLDVRLSVREADWSSSMTVEGQKVPSIRVQDFETTIEPTLGETVRCTGSVTRRTTAMRDDAGTREETCELEQWAFVTVESSEPAEHACAAAMQGVAPCPPVDNSTFRVAPASAP